MPVYTIKLADGKMFDVEVSGRGGLVESRLVNEGEKIIAIDGVSVKSI